MNFDQPPGPSIRDWANAPLNVTKVEREGEGVIYEFRKQMVINGVPHVQFVWLNQAQLRNVGIDHGL